MSDALKTAIERRDQIYAAKAALETELAEIDTYLRLHEKFSGTKVEVGDGEKERTISRQADQHEAAPARKRGRPADFAKIMRTVISEAGRPLNRPELADLLEKRGISIPSEDKPRYLGTILWRNRPFFRNLPGHGYWLVERPYPPAGYDPRLDTDELRMMESEAGLASEDKRITDEYETLTIELAEHDRRYHTENAPTISDATYDKLQARKRWFEETYPDIF